jgi:hypothetical protein
MQHNSETHRPKSALSPFQSGHKDLEFSDLEKRPEIVLSVLEPDQLVMAKERTRFGLRHLTVGIRAQLWGLRIYVIVMMIIVAVSVYRAIQAAH